VAQWRVSAEDFNIGDSWAECPFTLFSGSWVLSVEDTPSGRAFKFLKGTGSDRSWFQIDHNLPYSTSRNLLISQAALAAGQGGALFDPDIQLFTNSTGHSADGTGVTANLLSTHTLRICTLSPAFVLRASATLPYPLSSRHFLRVNFSAGAYNTTSWLIDEADATGMSYSSGLFTGSNDAVMTTRQNNGFFLYSFAIGTNGDPAPTGPVGPPASRRRSPLLLTPW